MTAKRLWEVGATAALLLALAGAVAGFLYLRTYYTRVNQQLAAVLDKPGYDWDRNATNAMRDLIRKGASVRTRGRVSAATALIAASMVSDADLVKEMLARRAEVDAHDNYGSTALMWAASSGSESVTRTLLAHGADVSARNRGGWTALMWAAVESQAAQVRLLLAAGADVNARSKDGETALSLAEMESHPDVVRLLKQAGAKK